MGSDTIAVVGAGNIGGTLARKWAAAGHRVVLGARDPSSPAATALAGELGPQSTTASVGQAVDVAPIVLFAIPGASMAATVGALGGGLAGKVVVDATNNMGAESTDSIAAITAAAPSALPYRAFNTLGWENFADPVIGGERADLFFCGPDGPGRAQVEALIAEVGLGPMWIGDHDKLAIVDTLTSLWFALASGRGFGRHTALRVLTEG